jgi:Protein of unknown function (DUF669)
MSTSNPVDEFDLGALDSAYHDAPDDDAPIPDGSYKARVERVELRRSKSSDKPMLEWTLVLLDSKYAGRKVWKYNVLEEDHLSRAKSDLKRVGLVLEKLSDLPSRLNDLLDVTVEISVKTKGDFPNVNFRRSQGNTASSTGGTGDRVF